MTGTAPLPCCSIAGCMTESLAPVVGPVPPYSDRAVRQEERGGYGAWWLCRAHLDELRQAHATALTAILGKYDEKGPEPDDLIGPGKINLAHSSEGTAQWLARRAAGTWRREAAPGSWLRTRDAVKDVWARRRRPKPAGIRKGQQTLC